MVDVKIISLYATGFIFVGLISSPLSVCVIWIKCIDSFFRIIRQESYPLHINENAIPNAVNFLVRIMSVFPFS